MGMFDYVYIECPVCKSTIEDQSKAGPCLLQNYNLLSDDTPNEVKDSFLGKALYCWGCHTKWTITVSPIIIKRVTLIPYHSKDEWAKNELKEIAQQMLEEVSGHGKCYICGAEEQEPCEGSCLAQRIRVLLELD